jgi:hypothetical protein
MVVSLQTGAIFFDRVMSGGDLAPYYCSHDAFDCRNNNYEGHL